MKRSLAAAAALALGASLGTGAAAAHAGWQDQVVISGTITAGYVHFAVDDPKDQPQDLIRISAPGETISWELPKQVLADLAPGAPQTAVVQIDAQSQGNRGLAYSLDGVQVSGDGALATAANVDIQKIDTPGKCSSPSDSAASLYDGQLVGARLGPRELVTTDYTDEPWTEPETEYLCLTLSVPDGMGDYNSTATVTGTADGGLDDDSLLSAQDGWSGTSVPDAAARNADVVLTFSYQTYRAEEQS